MSTARFNTLANAAGSKSVPVATVVDGSAKAWVTFNGTTGAIRGQFNVSSVTRNSTGTYTVAFTTAMPNTNYSSVATATQTALPDWACVRVPNLSNSEKLTGSITLGTGNRLNGTSSDCDDVSLTIFN